MAFLSDTCGVMGLWFGFGSMTFLEIFEFSPNSFMVIGSMFASRFSAKTSPNQGSKSNQRSNEGSKSIEASKSNQGPKVNNAI